MAKPAVKLERIEREAMRLFGERGLAAVTIKDIASAADAAEGALYRHYSGKEDMALKLFQRELGRFGSEISTILTHADRSPEERMKDAIQAFYRFYDRDPVVFNFIMLSQHNFPSRDLIEQDRNPNDLVVDFIRQGIAAKRFNSDHPEVTASIVYGMVLQPAIMHVYGRITGRLSDYTELVYNACLRVLKND